MTDGATMKLIGTIAMPADHLESATVDPATGRLYRTNDLWVVGSGTSGDWVQRLRCTP